MRDLLHPSYAPLDFGQPLRTRDGRAVRLLDANCKKPGRGGPYAYPVLAEVEHPNEPGMWVQWHYLRCGHWKSNDPQNPNDLVNVPRQAMH